MSTPDYGHAVNETEPCVGCLNADYYTNKVKEFLSLYEQKLDHATGQISYYTWVINSSHDILKKQPTHPNKKDIERSISVNIGKIRFHTKKQIILQTQVDTLKNELLTGEIPMYGNSDNEAPF